MVVFNVNVERRFVRNGSLTGGSRATQSETVRAALRWADAQTWRRRPACGFGGIPPSVPSMKGMAVPTSVRHLDPYKPEVVCTGGVCSKSSFLRACIQTAR